MPKLKAKELKLILSLSFGFLFLLSATQICVASSDSQGFDIYSSDIAEFPPQVDKPKKPTSPKRSKSVSKPKASKPKPKARVRLDLDEPPALQDNEGSLYSEDAVEFPPRAAGEPKQSLFSKYIKYIFKPNPKDYSFVALGTGFFGKYNVETELPDLGGDVADDDHKLKEDFFGEGRFAYYFKATLWDKYLVTSSLDTKRQESEIFRNLDDDKYYPTYGDDSTVVEETPTQGNFYLRIERDESYLMYGNYNTGFTGTEFASYNRSLYGTKLKFESLTQTKFDTPKNVLTGYIARARQLAAHDEMQSTGGSLYYLRHKRVIEGSEKIYILVRDKTNFSTLHSLVLTPDDYDIDYDEGRIILHNPASLTVASIDQTLIETTLPSGDFIYVIADYEYEPDGYFYNPSYGLRYSHEFGDYVKLGVTQVKEIEANHNYELNATDAVFRLNDKNTSNINLEYAQSKANTLANSVSNSGGIGFTEITTPSSSNNASADAWKIKLNLDIKDFLKLGSTESTDATVYYQNVDVGFSSTGTISQDGTEKFGIGFKSQLSKDTNVNFSHDTQRTTNPKRGTVYEGLSSNPMSDDYLLSTKSQITSVNVSHQLTPRAKLSQEYRHQEVLSPTVGLLTDEPTDLGATRLSYDFTDDFSGYAQQQYSFSGKENNLTTVGLSKTFTIESDKAGKDDAKEGLDSQDAQDTKITLNIDQSYGNLGDVTRVGISKAEPDGSTQYLKYSVDRNTRGEPSDYITLGQRLQISPETSIYQEDLFHNNYSGARGSRIMGLDYEPESIPGLDFGVNYEKVYFANESGDKDAFSFNTSYIKKDKINLSSKFEVRNSKADIDHHRQYLTVNKLEYRLNPALRFFADTEYSTTTDKITSSTDAHLQEYNLGLAYRPVKFDRLNLISRYTYVVDDTSPGQSDPRDIEESINHVYAIEGILDITPKLSLTEKYAKKINLEMGVGDGSHIKSTTDLILTRLSYNLFKDYSVDVEHRVLTQQLAQDRKEGILVELSKPIFKHFVVGVGYNFVDFDDELVEYMDSYVAEGPFFRVTMKVFESDHK